jgi:hypothetical protein
MDAKSVIESENRGKSVIESGNKGKKAKID